MKILPGRHRGEACGWRRGEARGWRRLMVAATALAVMLSSSVVFAQNRELESLINRLDRLERDIRTLNVQSARQVPSSATVVSPARSAPAAAPAGDIPPMARLEIRLATMEEELRAMTGRDEQLIHQIDQINMRLEKLVGDVDFRLSGLEQAVRAASAGAPRLSAAPSPPSVATAAPQGGSFATEPKALGVLRERNLRISGDASAQTVSRVATLPVQPRPQRPSILPAGTQKERYQFAFDLLRRAHYEKAEQAFLAFIEVHGDDPLAVNARYWLGEVYYVRGNYVRAAEVFLQGFQKEPKGNKAPDTLLKLGMALANLDKSREACAAFDKLQADFPEAPDSIQSTVRRQRKRSACN